MRAVQVVLMWATLWVGVGCAHPVHEARPVRDLAGTGLEDPPAGRRRNAAWAWTGVAWSADGKLVAGGNKDGTIRVWEVGSGRDVGHVAGYVRSGGARGGLWDAGVMAFSPDGGRLAFAAEGERVCVWEIGSGRVTELVGQPRMVREVRFAPDGRRVVTASGGVRVRRPTTRPATGPTMIVGPTTVVVFDAETGREVSRVIVEGFLAAALAPDGERFVGLRVVGDQAAVVEVRRVTTAEVLVRIVPSEVGGWLWAQFSPDGRWLLGGGSVWDTAAWRAVRDVGVGWRALVDGGRRALCVRLGRTGGWKPSEWLGGPSWVEIRYVDVRRGTTHDAGRWHGSGLEWAMTAIPPRMSPDGRWVVDGMMRVWEVPR